MGHFAKVLNGKVVNVIVAEPEFFETFVDSSPGTWLATSYNTHGNQHANGGTPVRGNFAGIGYLYDANNDVFYEPKPFDSWTLNESTWLWESPIPKPNDGKLYLWDEPTQTWVEQNV